MSRSTSTTIEFTPLTHTSQDRAQLVQFLSHNEFPFHVRSRRTEESVHEALAQGAFYGEDELSLWVDHAEHGRIGLVVVEDIEEDEDTFAPLFDLRLAEAWRGRGLGAEVLRELTAFVFDRWPQVSRFEGQTRGDNVAMRRVFESCGWVLEAHYREAWPVEGQAPQSSIAYGMLRRDFTHGTTTPGAQAALGLDPGHHRTGLHHLELWTANLTVSETEWEWLLTTLGWVREDSRAWETGRVWSWADATYVYLEQSPDCRGTRADRCAPGMNHVAFRTGDRALLDAMRREGPAHGWVELFGEKYPHAGGPEHVAWYAQNSDGIEVEVVYVGE